jgi:hypothetical protein
VTFQAGRHHERHPYLGLLRQSRRLWRQHRRLGREPGTDGVIYARTGTVWEWVEMDLLLEMNEDPYHWRLPTDL